MMEYNKKIAIIDYGLGNLHSIKKAIDYFTDDCIVTSEQPVIMSAKAVVLPGVGAFKAGMDGLQKRGLVECIKKFAESGRPMLGICLGAQMFLTEGCEFGLHQGLDIIGGKVVRFPNSKEAKIPHVGWNKIYQSKHNNWNRTILNNIKEMSNLYFVHSYILQPANQENIFSLSNYEGYEFCSAIRKGNIYGCQFHPEKSGEVGLAIIKNFIELIK